MRFLFVRNFDEVHVHVSAGHVVSIHEHHHGMRPHIHSETYRNAQSNGEHAFLAYSGVKLCWDKHSENAFYVGRTI
jgi:hypothetical protein